MDFSVKVDGLDKIQKASDRVKTEVVKELQKALYASALKVQREAQDSIRKGQKSGRIYKRGDKIHRASAPGEAPASDTGRLVNSITAHLNKISMNKLESFVVAGRGVVKYARMLEFGTAKIAARPFMLPAFEKNRRWIQERLNKAVRTAAIRISKK